MTPLQSDLLFATALEVVQHIPQVGIQSDSLTVTSASNRTNERARLIQRQRRGVAAKSAPDAVLVQVLSDVRKIEGRHGGIHVFEILAYGANRRGSAEISHDGNNEVFCLEVFQNGKILFGCEIAARLPTLVRGNHQLRIGDTAVSATTAAGTRVVVDVGSKPVEVAVHVIDTAKIVDGNREPVRKQEMVLNRL